MAWCCGSKAPLTASSPGEAPLSIVELSALLAAGGSPAGEPPPPSTKPEEIGVKVVIRVRPFIAREGKGEPSIIDVTTPSSLKIRGGAQGEATPFTFDCVLGAAATQGDTFTSVAQNVLAKVLTGFNGCVFAYGQTGSGKT